MKHDYNKNMSSIYNKSKVPRGVFNNNDSFQQKWEVARPQVERIFNKRNNRNNSLLSVSLSLL